MSSSDENDVDVEGSEDFDTPAGLNKREHHNLLERKRRDHIKDSFAVLRDSIPSLQGEKASRAQILNRATDYIQETKERNANTMAEIERIRKDNEDVEKQIRALEEDAGLSPVKLPEPCPSRSLNGIAPVVFAGGASGYHSSVPRNGGGRVEHDRDADDERDSDLPSAKRARGAPRTGRRS